MRLFVERVQRQAAVRVGQGRSQVALLDMAAHEARQHRAQIAAQMLGLEDLPFVELGAVGQREAGQEVVAVERGGPRQRFDAGGADLFRRVVVRFALGHEGAEAGGVHEELASSGQFDAVALESPASRRGANC